MYRTSRGSRSAAASGRGAALSQDPFLHPEVDARLVAIMADTGKQLEHGPERLVLHLEQLGSGRVGPQNPFVNVRGFDRSSRTGRMSVLADRIDPEGLLDVRFACISCVSCYFLTFLWHFTRVGSNQVWNTRGFCRFQKWRTARAGGQIMQAGNPESVSARVFSVFRKTRDLRPVFVQK